MDPRKVSPPRAADVLLRWCLPVATRLTILGDLREAFHARTDRGDPAYWWYWREALLLSARYVAERGPRESTHQRRAWTFGNDCRMAVRALRRTPATAAIVVLTLSVAIGASAIGFSFADLALLRGLPIANADEVVGVYGVDTRQTDGRARLSLANYRDLRARVTTLENFTAFHGGRATLLDRGIPISLEVTRVTPEFFAAVGIGVAAGRSFMTGDDQPGRLAVVLAHHYWQRVHGKNPAVIGTQLLVDGRSHVVVGVAKPEMEFGNLATTNLWLPLEIGADASRTERVVTTMARLRKGVSIETAHAEVSAISNSLAMTYAQENRDWKAMVLPIRDVAFGRGFWVIIGLFSASVVLLMLIACANAASLVLARALAARREIAMRSALGAGRWRLLRQALIEGLLLAALSAVCAVPIAEAALRAIKSFDSEPAIQQLALDGHEWGFIGLIALLTPVVFAVLPTLAAVRLDVRTALQSGGTRLTASGTRGRSVLVALQLILAVTLLTAAGLAVRTGVNLSLIDYGIRTSDALSFAMNVPDDETSRAEPYRFLDTVRTQLQPLPGVAGVYAFHMLPVLGSERLISFDIEGRPSVSGDLRPWALSNQSDAQALAAMGVPLVAGRWITEAEERRGARVALIGETTARLFFTSPERALGQHVRPAIDGSSTLEIIGVVGDVLSNDVERGNVPRLWTAFESNSRLTFIVTTRGTPPDLAGSIRRAMATVAPSTPLEQLESIEYAFARFQASNQVVIGVFAGFAVVALVLAALGLYGLINYTVGLRMSEFGTRFALGARPLDVLNLVLRQVGRLTSVAAGIGLLAGLAVGQGMRSVLYGVTPTDPLTIGGVTALIALVAIAASIRPAIRAARLNLIEALRAE